MIINPNSDPVDVRAGVWKHYKGPLYQVLGYSHNASNDNKPQILYIGLEIDPEKIGPRFATRDWVEFFETVCTVHSGVDAYGGTHFDMIERSNVKCDPDRHFVERFTYMGPVYYKGFEN